METDSTELIEYITKFAQTIDYQYLASIKPVLFLADIHMNNPIRTHIGGYAADFKKAGTTHYAIEASNLGQPVFDQLKNSEVVDLTGIELGPDGGTNYEFAIRSMASTGIKIRAIDIEREKINRVNEREEYMFQQVQNIFNEDPSSKVAILIGALHTRRTGFYFILNTKPLGTRLFEAGIDSTTVRFICGQSGVTSAFNNAIILANLENCSFMMPLKKPKQLISYGIDNSDYIIYLP